MPTVREEARKIIDQLSDDATWEDLAYQIFVRQKIERGVQEADAGLLQAFGIAEFGILRIHHAESHWRTNYGLCAAVGRAQSRIWHGPAQWWKIMRDL
jgi:hypothetical protein